MNHLWAAVFYIAISCLAYLVYRLATRNRKPGKPKPTAGQNECYCIGCDRTRPECDMAWDEDGDDYLCRTCRGLPEYSPIETLGAWMPLADYTSNIKPTAAYEAKLQRRAEARRIRECSGADRYTVRVAPGEEFWVDGMEKPFKNTGTKEVTVNYAE